MRILYNMGDLCSADDFNQQQDLLQKTLFDSLIWNLSGNEYPGYSAGNLRHVWNPGTSYGSLIRPLRQAGMMSTTSSSVTVSGGLFAQLSTLGLNADNAVTSVAAYSGGTVGSIAAASAGQFRRDLVQCRITSIDAAQESRDYQDDITRAKSSALTTKRSDLTVEISVKTGTEGTAAFADNPINLVAVDSGWSVIGAIRVSDTGVSTTAADLWDYRMPWGYWQAWSTTSSFATDVGNHWSDGSDANGLHMTSVGISNIIWCWCPTVRVPSRSSSPGDSAGYTAMRIDRVNLLSDFGATPPLATDVAFEKSAVFLDSGTNTLLVGTRVTSSAGSHTLYDVSSTNDPPLWSNGETNPRSASHDLPKVLRLGLNSRNVGDKVYGVEWFGWGGV